MESDRLEQSNDLVTIRKRPYYSGVVPLKNTDYLLTKSSTTPRDFDLSLLVFALVLRMRASEQIDMSLEEYETTIGFLFVACRFGDPSLS